MVTMVTMGGDPQPGCLADRLLIKVYTTLFQASV